MAAKKTKKKPPTTKETKKTREQVLKDNAWPPGQSGNPAGRPRGTLSLTTISKEIGDWPCPKSVLDTYKQLFPALPEEATCAQILGVRNWLKALDLKTGDIMAKELWERIDGKVPFPISGEGGGPIPVKFDFKSLTKEELSIFERLLGKVQIPEAA